MKNEFVVCYSYRVSGLLSNCFFLSLSLQHSINIAVDVLHLRAECHSQGEFY